MAFQITRRLISRMVGRALRLYRTAYSGIPREVWWLSLIMLINRAGSMVFPFLSLYLVTHLHFSKVQAAWILSAYGLGSMMGSLLGGWLADRTGYFRIQFASLVLSGLGWLMMMHVTGFWPLLLLTFCQSTVMDMLRPANAAAITNFASQGDITRSYSLNRMAMNLGYSIGPAVGGLLATISYDWLFITDAVSSVLAAAVLILLFRNEFSRMKKQDKQLQKQQIRSAQSPYRDPLFLIFTGCVILFSAVFFQLIFTLPLYYKQVYGFNEGLVGMFMALNGLIIVFIEMIFVHTVGKMIPVNKLIVNGVFLTGISFLMLNWVHAPAWLVFSMFLLCLAEIMAMPFMSTFVSDRAPKVRIGAYMSLYSFAFSLGLILAPYVGMRVIEYQGFDQLWLLTAAVTTITSFILWAIFRRLHGSAQST